MFVQSTKHTLCAFWFDSFMTRRLNPLMRFVLLFTFLCQFAAADPIECRRLVGKIPLDPPLIPFLGGV